MRGGKLNENLLQRKLCNAALPTKRGFNYLNYHLANMESTFQEIIFQPLLRLVAGLP